ncbi:DUF6879 family protein [Streptosporangium sp. G11]|uniref:DUF6879 family protein n=1 Tax=Streptosporangium sp. G11 TaxID=3436926 RepID=UPI003EBA1EE5
MKITFLGKDPESRESDCPSLYDTDRHTYLVQGWKITIDDSAAIVGHFDADGRPAGRELIKDPDIVSGCVRARDLLWGLAIPHADYKPVMA